MKHSDLAVESAHIPAGTSGTRCVSRTIGGVKITDIRLSNSAARTISRRPGRYITLEGDPAGNALPALLKRALEQLLPPTGKILAAGLGNPDITRDRLGALTVRRLSAKSGKRYSLAAIETDVALHTGIETAALVRSAARATPAHRSLGRTMVCFQVLDERGLIQVEQREHRVRVTIHKPAEKVDLEQSELMKKLRTYLKG